jgi:acetyl esterase
VYRVTLAPAIQQMIDESPRHVPEHLSMAEEREYMRLLSDLTFLRFGLPGPPVHAVTDHRVPVDGGHILVRVYRPGPEVDLPVHLTLHGGGWRLGSVDERVSDAVCRQRCREARCVVVAVDYRLAPEHKFPAGIEDAVSAYRWLASEATRLGIDPARIVIAGDSAGGNVAAVAARLLREEPRPPCLQWLIFPVTDLGFDTGSFGSCGEGFLVTRSAMEWFRGHYLSELAEIDDPRASPLKANDLAGLPPALIYTAGFDPLRDEGHAYADRLMAAGVKTIHREFDSLVHGFVGLRGTVQAAARAMDDMVAGLRHELAQLGR